MKQESPTKVNEQVKYYNFVIRKIREGRFKSAVERLGLTREKTYSILPSKNYEIWRRFLNPERLAAEQIIIEEFFNSAAYDRAKTNIFMNVQTSLVRPIISTVIASNLSRFLDETDNPITKNAVALLKKNEQVFGLDYIPGEKDFVRSIDSGLNTADYFCHCLESLVKEKLNDQGPFSEEEKMNIIRAVRSTFQAQSVFFGSFSISSHNKSLQMLDGDNSRLDFDDKLYEGDLKKGLPLKPNKAILNKLAVINMIPALDGVAKFRCPAIIRTGHGDTPMKKFALLCANILLHDLGLITEEEMINSTP